MLEVHICIVHIRWEGRGATRRRGGCPLPPSIRWRWRWTSRSWPSRTAALYTALVKRQYPPHEGGLGVAGRFREGTRNRSNTRRPRVSCATKRGLSGVYLEQLYTFGSPRSVTRACGSSPWPTTPSSIGSASRKCPEDLLLARLRVPWEGETGGPVELEDEEGRKGDPRLRPRRHARDGGQAHPRQAQLLTHRFSAPARSVHACASSRTYTRRCSAPP